MKKIGLLVRETIVDQVKQKAQDSNACIFLDFSKLPAFSVNLLRNDLADAGANMFVAKNTLLKKSFEDMGYSEFDELLDKETAVVFVQDIDVVKPCKILFDFSKENENLKLKGGFLKEKKISAKDVDAMAKLPSKEVLLGMAVRGIASPLSGFLSCLNQVITKFVWVIEDIKKKKEQR